MSERLELDDDVKRMIVQALACWDTPSEVARAVKDEFGIVITRQAVEAYDPTKRAGAALSAEFRALFEATRTTFLQETASIGTSHRVVRLRRLDRLVSRAEAQGNISLTADLLAQIAKEVGGSFTNHVAMKHSGAVTVDARPDFSALSRDERDVLKLLLEKAEEAKDGEAAEAAA